MLGAFEKRRDDSGVGISAGDPGIWGGGGRVFETQKQMWALGDRKVRECSLLMKTEEDRWFGDE